MGRKFIIIMLIQIGAYSQGLKKQEHLNSTDSDLVTNFWKSEKVFQSFCQLYKLPCRKGKLHISFFFRNDNIFKIQESTVRDDLKDFVSSDFLFTFDQMLEFKVSLDSNRQIGGKIKMSEFTLPRGSFKRYWVNSEYGDLVAHSSMPYHDFDYYKETQNEMIEVEFYGGSKVTVSNDNFSFFLSNNREKFNSLDDLIADDGTKEGDIVYRYQLMPDGTYHPVEPYLITGEDTYRPIGRYYTYGDIEEEDTSQYFSNKTQLLFHFSRLWNLENPEKFFPIFLHTLEGSIEAGMSIIDYKNHSIIWGATRWQEMFHSIGDQTEFHYIGQNIDRQIHPKIELGGRAIFALIKKFFIESVFNLGLGTHESDRYASLEFNLGLPLFENHLQVKATSLFGITDDDKIFSTEELVSKRIGFEVDLNITKRVSLNYGMYYFLSTKPYQPDYNIMSSPTGERVLFNSPDRFSTVQSQYDGRATKYLGQTSPRALPYHQLKISVHFGGGKNK
ncbi:hypothetical protein N9N67_03815 [Bacteriovoracaceae bacterium]|nr:hypothetical protein [Bacteriovoracaceae bacterium]